MNVLSLFDGISCGRVALERAGIKVDTYYASEIDKYAIKITQKNYPDTIQLGNVKTLLKSKYKNLGIDLLMGGSPCEDLSITAVDRKNIKQGLKGKKSRLFFKFVAVLKHINPKYFLFENVASMTEENKNYISKLLGVEPILIDSNLVTAQDRQRYYWTNIPNIQQPEDKGLTLKDIMETNVPEKYYYNKPFEFYGLDKKICAKLHINSHDITKRVYSPNFKCGTLTAVQGGYQEKKVYDNGRIRKLTPIEYERLQTLPDNYTYGVCDSVRYSLCGNGWTVDVIAHILKHIKY